MDPAVLIFYAQDYFHPWWWNPDLPILMSHHIEVELAIARGKREIESEYDHIMRIRDITFDLRSYLMSIERYLDKFRFEVI